MTLEEFTAQLNASTFWKEFTFSQTKFYPRPKQQVELADGVILIGPTAYILQLKERVEETDNPQVEKNWFQSKVVKKATKQIRDSLGYLADNESIQLTNEQDHTIKVRGSELADITNIVIFRGAQALPKECRSTQFHISETAGFIHIVEAHDYFGIHEYLRVPEEIRRYFGYRETALPRLREKGVTIEEPDIMFGYLSELDLPVPNSRQRLSDFVQDLEEFDLSYIMGNLLNNIQNHDQKNDYYKILVQFARSPRSVWREFKKRLMLSLDAAKAEEFCRPYRFTFPALDCTFMIASLDPSHPVIGSEGERIRSNGLELYTRAAKYAARSTLGVGLLVSKHEKDVHLDWCLLDEPWEPDDYYEKFLTETSIFRPVSEKKIDGFFFRNSGGG